MGRNLLDEFGGLTGLVRRSLRWYFSPSGFLLLLGLLVVAVAVATGQRGFGLVAVAIAGVFLPYRFARQQGHQTRELERLALATSERAGKVAKRLTAIETRANRKIERIVVANRQRSKEVAELRTSLDSMGSSIGGTSERLAGELTVYGNGIDELEEKVVAMCDLLDELATARLATFSRLDQIAGDVNGLAGDVNRLAGVSAGVDEVRAELDSLADRLAGVVTPPDLEALQTRLSSQVEDVSLRQDELADRHSDLANQVGEANEAATARLDTLESSDSDLERRFERVRSDVNLSVASAGLGLERCSRAIVIVAPQRSGSTWVFDVLRSLPGASQLGPNTIYELLGVSGNRYPRDLLTSQTVGEPIQVAHGVGAVLAPLRSTPIGATGSEIVAVEKVHPSALNFDPAAFARGLRRLRERVDVQVVLLARSPSEAYASFVEYQEVGDWHTDFEAHEVAGLYGQSFRFMNQIRDSIGVPVTVVDFGDVRADPLGAFKTLADRLGLKADHGDVAAVLRRSEDWRLARKSNPYFSKPPSRLKPSQVLVGRGLGTNEAKDALDVATAGYQSLLSEPRERSIP